MGTGASSTVQSGILRASLAVHNGVRTVSPPSNKQEDGKPLQRKAKKRRTQFTDSKGQKNSAPKKNRQLKKRLYSFNNLIFADRASRQQKEDVTLSHSFAKLEAAWEVEHKRGETRLGTPESAVSTDDSGQPEAQLLKPMGVSSRPSSTPYPIEAGRKESHIENSRQLSGVDVENWINKQIACSAQPDKVKEKSVEKEASVDETASTVTSLYSESDPATLESDEQSPEKLAETALQVILGQASKYLKMQESEEDPSKITRMLKYDTIPLLEQMRERYGAIAATKIEEVGDANLLQFYSVLREASVERQEKMDDTERLVHVLVAKKMTVAEAVQALRARDWDYKAILNSTPCKGVDTTVVEEQTNIFEHFKLALAAVQRNSCVDLKREVHHLDAEEVKKCLTAALLLPSGVNIPVCDLLIGRIKDEELQKLFIQCALMDKSTALRYLHAVSTIHATTLGKAAQAAVLKTSTSALEVLLQILPHGTTEVDIALLMAAKRGNVAAARKLMPKASLNSRLHALRIAEGRCTELPLRAHVTHTCVRRVVIREKV